MVQAQPVFTYEFKPSLKIVGEDLDKLGADIRSFKEPLKRCIQQVIIPSIRKNFDSGGRPTWPPYADSTIEFHQELGQAMSKSLLVKSGALRSAATTLAIWSINKEEAKVTDLPARVWYGKIHQGGGRGGKGPGGAIPARPFIMLQVEDEEKIIEVFAKWLDERIAKRWTK